MEKACTSGKHFYYKHEHGELWGFMFLFCVAKGGWCCLDVAICCQNQRFVKEDELRSHPARCALPGRGLGCCHHGTLTCSVTGWRSFQRWWPGDNRRGAWAITRNVHAGRQVQQEGAQLAMMSATPECLPVVGSVQTTVGKWGCTPLTMVVSC